MRKRIYTVLESNLPGSLISRIVNVILISLIITSVTANVLASVPSIFVQFHAWFSLIELVTVAVFTIEYALRLWSCMESPDPEISRHPLKGRLRFALKPILVVDLLAILPFYLGLWVTADLMFLRVFRLFRIFKLTRYSPAMGLMLTVLRKEARSFGAAMFIMLVVLIFAASGIYLVENEAQPQQFGSIPAAMWWAVATLTTVGYGDVTPITLWGKVFGACVTIVGVGMVALPAGILASAFSDELRQRREKYSSLVEAALQDGRIDRDEKLELDETRRHLGIGTSDADNIEKRLEQSSGICPHCGKPLDQPPGLE